MGLVHYVQANGPAFMLSILSSLLAVIIYDSAPSLAEWLVQRSARRLHLHAADREEEWLADLLEFDGKIHKLGRALGFVFASFAEQPPLASTLVVVKELVLIGGTAAHRLPMLWVMSRRAKRIVAHPTFSSSEQRIMRNFGLRGLEDGNRILVRMHAVLDAMDAHNGRNWEGRARAYESLEKFENTMSAVRSAVHGNDLAR